MNSYTITITPNDNSGNTTTLVVDASGDDVRITDVHLHASVGLAGGQMPTVDFGLLLRAITTTTTAAPAPIEAAPAGAPIHATPDLPTSDPAGEHPATTEPAPPAGPAPAARTRRRTQPPAAAPARPEPAKRTRTRSGPAAKATAATNASAAPTKASKTASTRRTAKTATTSGERAYRRMPDDFTSMYQQVGTTAAVADHYGVPRHTVQGWLRRIRATTATPARR